MKVRKKLIEVALPLDAINVASAREKSIRHGHPSTLHLWWARRPLAAARAVIFSQMVDDPSEYVDTLKMDNELRCRAETELKKRHKVWEELSAAKEKADAHGIESPDPGPEPNLDEIIAEHERERLFKIIEELVKWENTTNEAVLEKARAEIWQSWRRACADNADHPRAAELFDRNKLPAFHDPFAGGGALPLEAQRLGLEAYASDLNPVAVLINKAMIEIPPKFAGRPPVSLNRGDAESQRSIEREWKGAEGLAEDVRYYGKWMRDEAEKRIGHLYPKIKVVQNADGTFSAAETRSRGDNEDENNDISASQRLGSSEKELTVIAWIWARTVKSPNPAFRHVDVPLASTFMLSTKAGKEAYVEPIIENGGYRFEVRNGKPADPEAAKAGTKASRGFFKCLLSEQPIPYSYVDDEANAGRMGSRLMAIVAEGPKGRVYLSPDDKHIKVALSAKPTWKPETASRGTWASNAQGRIYGFKTFGDYFTSRQLVALTTFSDLVGEAIEKIEKDAVESAAYAIASAKNAEGLANSADGIANNDTVLAKSADGIANNDTALANSADGIANNDTVLANSAEGIANNDTVLAKSADGIANNDTALATNAAALSVNDTRPLNDGGLGPKAYAQAVAVYLGFAVDKCSDYWSTICSWINTIGAMRNTFARQAIPMVWDYAEVNSFSDSTGNWMAMVDWTWKALSRLPAHGTGSVSQSDAQNQNISLDKIVSTDPPYYDNIGYADLSDYFYVWMRRSFRQIFSSELSTLAVPKTEELVATQYRHGSKKAAEQFFLDGMTLAMNKISDGSHLCYPATIYYAFKQAEKEVEGTASTGWETFLDAVIRSGFTLGGTWPMRTEFGNRPVSDGANALASSIVLVCRKRPDNAPTVTRREFINELKAKLPTALRHLQSGNIAPVDLAQAAIGPGMAVFTKYENVLDAEGNKLTVREALALINRTLDETLAEQEGDFDPDTRWALAWFEEFGFETGEYGRAEQLSKAKNTSISEMADPRTSPILEAKAGKVRLFRPTELEKDWSPETDGRLTVWDMVHQLIRVLEKDGEAAAASIVAKLGARAETARELCYRLYTICERKKRASDALSYNALVQSWPEIGKLAAVQATPSVGKEQSLPGM